MKTSVLILLLLAGKVLAYDPLTGTNTVKTLDLTLTDESRQREIPLRVYFPAEEKPAPVLLFSHGLGGSRTGSAFLGQHWAARGYVVVYLQHPGSDTGVWQDQPREKRLAAMQQAASAQNFLLRVKDVPAVLDKLTAVPALAGRLDMNRVGLSGHSFGAVTTQAVSGQHFPVGEFTDPRIKAALPMSPSSPRAGNPATAFGKVKIPWLLMTGTKDNSLIGNSTPESRRAVYPALPAGGKYELVLNQAEHSAFTDRPLPGDSERRNPNHHRAILAISTAFWDAYLAGNAEAKTWLDGTGPRSVLESKDEWQRK